jgi:hypothetical protein
MRPAQAARRRIDASVSPADSNDPGRAASRLGDNARNRGDQSRVERGGPAGTDRKGWAHRPFGALRPRLPWLCSALAPAVRSSISPGRFALETTRTQPGSPRNSGFPLAAGTPEAGPAVHCAHGRRRGRAGGRRGSRGVSPQPGASGGYRPRGRAAPAGRPQVLDLVAEQVEAADLAAFDVQGLQGGNDLEAEKDRLGDALEGIRPLSAAS